VPTIGLVGGNSQVATEVALFLSLRPGVQVVPICRSSIGSAFLHHCGLSSRNGTMNDPSAARELLSGLDLVADFSLPLGPAGEMRRRTGSGVTQLVQHSPTASRVVYISTEMAFGLGQGDTDRRYRLFAIARSCRLTLCSSPWTWPRRSTYASFPAARANRRTSCSP
jgi:hypothetical protein